mgnify:CR=1 FL=1
MMARLKVLLVRLAIDVVAILVNVKAVARGRARRPDICLFGTTTTLEVLTDHNHEENANQEQQENHRDHEVKLQRR